MFAPQDVQKAPLASASFTQFGRFDMKLSFLFMRIKNVRYRIFYAGAHDKNDYDYFCD